VAYKKQFAFDVCGIRISKIGHTCSIFFDLFTPEQLLDIHLCMKDMESPSEGLPSGELISVIYPI